MNKTSYFYLFLFLSLKLVVHYNMIGPGYDLHRDEFLHLDQANHLAAGYLSVPPFTAFLSLLIKWLGGGIFWVRFFPALFGALTMVVIWKLIELLKGGPYAQEIAAFVFISSAMSRLNMLYQPNSFDVLCWTMTFYLLIRYVKEGTPGLLLSLGGVIGIGFLNKYNILFLVMALIPALLFSSHRKIFLNKYLYGGVLIALLLALPNVIWQFRNDFPVIHHMKELAATQLVNVERWGFVKEQLLFFLFGTLVWVAALIGFVRYMPFRPYRFVGLTFLFVMVLFLYMRAKAYYALGVYPVLIAFGSVYWERILDGESKRLYWLRRLGMCVVAFPFFLLYDILFPVKAPRIWTSGPFPREAFAKWEDGKEHSLPQDFADMLGWRELAGLAVKSYEQVPAAERRNTLILCDNYGQAGAINYYAGKKVSSAVSFSADYVNWFPKMDSLHYLIIVGEEPGEYVRKYASGYTKTGQISDTLAREYGTGVYLVQGISPDFLKKLKQWQKEQQDSYKARIYAISR